MVNVIKKIVIENIKGRKEMKFDKFNNGVIANYANILVAHNGFGKSTMSTAFEALKNTRINLDEKDRFYKDPSKEPRITVEMDGEKKGIFIANESRNDFYKNKIYVSVIKSPIYAKDTSKRIGGFSTKSADIRVKTIEVCKVVKSVKIDYSVKKYAHSIDIKHTMLINYNNYFDNFSFWEMLSDNIDTLGKSNGVRVKTKINQFLNNPTLENAKNAYDNEIIFTTAHFINKLEKNDSFVESKELIYKVAQMFDFYNSNKEAIKKYIKFMKYKKIKDDINEDLKLFDTTNKNIKCVEKKGVLEINFGTANDMSNGERDVLSFIGNLKKYELDFNYKYGILIIDEVFDYLDGANMLAVQFYLQKFIDRVKESGRILFPIILTHLDPVMFKNYYLKKQRVHYLESVPSQEVDSTLLQFLIDRNIRKSDEDIVIFEKAFIHYYPEEESLETEDGLVSKNDFYKDLKDNIDKCCLNNVFDPLKVVAAIRIIIEKYLYDNLDEKYKKEIIEMHRTDKKIRFAEENGVDIPFEFYLLAPLYNDSLHIDKKNMELKIKSCYLKMCNGQVQNIIKSMIERVA